MFPGIKNNEYCSIKRHYGSIILRIELTLHPFIDQDLDGEDLTETLSVISDGFVVVSTAEKGVLALTV